MAHFLSFTYRISVFCRGERREVPGVGFRGGSQPWQTFCCPAAPAVTQCVCNMSGMAQGKQNYVIWKVPVILKAMKDLPGSFCKAVQKRYFGMTVMARLELFPASTTKKMRGLFMHFKPGQNNSVVLSPPRMWFQVEIWGLSYMSLTGDERQLF